jgi:ribosomal protein S18 acetylase RimI-like enzyme
MEPLGSQAIWCPAEQRVAALRQLHADLPADQQAALALALNQLDPADHSPWDGLFIAAPAGESQAEAAPAAAVWVQRCAGKTAVVWPPPPNAAAAESLLQAAAAFAADRAIPLTQLLLAADHAYSPTMLRAAGFEKLAEFIYLFADAAPDAALPAATASAVQFVPHALEQRDRLAAIIERTYEGSRDCPALDGARNLADVLDGYRDQGEYLPEQWHVVVADGGDAGALILANHPAVGNWELVYMGVAPEFRGRGLGEQIVQFALQAASVGGAERLVLAVDAENEPAIGAYRRAGFHEWDRRSVYGRLQSRS